MRRVVKATFNQRRKMIRNSLKSVFNIGDSPYQMLTKDLSNYLSKNL
ncbi:MAG: hypothetical protein R2727_02595 [Bacteroidales bacterium]